MAKVKRQWEREQEQREVPPCGQPAELHEPGEECPACVAELNGPFETEEPCE